MVGIHPCVCWIPLPCPQDCPCVGPRRSTAQSCLDRFLRQDSLRKERWELETVLRDPDHVSLEKPAADPVPVTFSPSSALSIDCAGEGTFLISQEPHEGAGSVKAELLTGLISANLATKANDPETMSMNRSNARIAHDTACRKLKSIDPSPADLAEIESGFRELRATLRQLGESL